MNKVKLKTDNEIWNKIGNKTIGLLSTARNAVVILVCSIVTACLPEAENDFTLTGNITAGLPPFQPPPFSLEYGNQTMSFGQVFQNVGSSVFVIALIGLLESVAIAKSFG